MTPADPSTAIERLIAEAREAVTTFRDAARQGLEIGFRKRDPLVMTLHRALDALASETQARQEAETQLSEAASRINCAGPVAHRIDVLRKELSEQLTAEREARQQAEARATYEIWAMHEVLQQAERERDGWRSWAQFVYLRGGPVSGTDKEMQAAVCAAHDAQLTASERARAQAEQEAADWRLSFETANEALAGLDAAEERATNAETEREAMRTALRAAAPYIEPEMYRGPASSNWVRAKMLVDAALTDPDWPVG